MKIEEINKYETHFLYEEIFINRTYNLDDISIQPNDIVFDIGANIGLFTMYINAIVPKSIIYSFEPSKEAFVKLKKNCKNNVYNIGISNIEGNKSFTYYPGYSVISGFYTNKEKDKSVILKGELATTSKDIHTIKKDLNTRFNKETSYQVNVTTISSFLEKEKIKSIKLLKIDVEKSEFDVIAGIFPKDFIKIENIIVEVHGKNKSEKIKSILEYYHFDVKIKEDIFLKDAQIFLLTAKNRLVPPLEILKQSNLRNDLHIKMVTQNMIKMQGYLDTSKKELIERSKSHDKSKKSIIEQYAYAWNFWKFQGNTLPKEIEDFVTNALKNHHLNNSHHPEYYCKPDSMNNLDIIEMACDWMSIAQENGTNCLEWAETNIDKKWNFNQNNKTKILNTIIELQRRLDE